MNDNKKNRKYKQVVERHLNLKSAVDVSLTPVPIEQIQNFMRQVSSSGQNVFEPEKRDSLRAILRFWAAYIFNEIGNYPDTSLVPAKYEKIAKSSFNSKDRKVDQTFPDYIECISCKNVFKVSMYHKPNRELKRFPMDNLHSIDSKNCPRCGIDNAQWIKLLRRESKLENRIKRWVEQFPLVVVSFILSVILQIIIIIILIMMQIDVQRILLLLFFTNLGWYILLNQIVQPWKKLREDLHLEKIVKVKRRYKVETYLWIKVIMITVFISIVLPLLNYFFLQALVLTKFENSLLNLLVLLSDSKEFIDVWVLSVGGITLITSILMVMSTLNYIKRIDSNLPPPIFEKISLLTFVSLEELRNALNVSVIYFNEIQWMSSERNELGGIDISGLFRDTPTSDDSEEISKTVRAQLYSGKTDLWGRLIEVSIKDIEVPAPAGFVQTVTREIPVPIPFRRNQLDQDDLEMRETNLRISSPRGQHIFRVSEDIEEE